MDLLRGDGGTLEAQTFACEMVNCPGDQIGRAEPERLSASRLALDAALMKAAGRLYKNYRLNEVLAKQCSSQTPF